MHQPQARRDALDALADAVASDDFIGARRRALAAAKLRRGTPRGARTPDEQTPGRSATHTFEPRLRQLRASCPSLVTIFLDMTAVDVLRERLDTRTGLCRKHGLHGRLEPDRETRSLSRGRRPSGWLAKGWLARAADWPRLAEGSGQPEA